MLLRNYINYVISTFLKKFGSFLGFELKYHPPPYRNLFNSRQVNKKRVLISFVERPFFRRPSKYHTIDNECLALAKAWASAGYIVDVINFENDSDRLNFSVYTYIVGFGTPFEKSFYEKNLIRVFYGNGANPIWSNEKSSEALTQFWVRNGVFLFGSGRVTLKNHLMQWKHSDYYIILGNEFTKSTYLNNVNNTRFFLVKGFYHHVISNRFKNDFSSIKTHFLWFGGIGFIHKGLDLLLEVFRDLPDFHLHICGQLEKEKRFCDFYRKELFETKNIHTYGYVDILSNEFDEILSKCAFCVLPSVSEGPGISMTTAIGNGGLIPIASHAVGTDFSKDEGFRIPELSKDSLREVLLEASNMKVEKLEKMSLQVSKRIRESMHYKNFLVDIEKCVLSIDRDSNINVNNN